MVAIVSFIQLAHPQLSSDHFPNTYFNKTLLYRPVDLKKVASSTLPQMSVSSNPLQLDDKYTLSSLAPLKAILFDIDGSLCDSDPIHYSAFREMLQEAGFNGGIPITEEFFIRNIRGRHNNELFRVLFPDWDLQRARKFMEDKKIYSGGVKAGAAAGMQVVGLSTGKALLQDAGASFVIKYFDDPKLWTESGAFREHAKSLCNLKQQ